MKLAVVILNWNGKALLKQFLPSVVAYSAEATVYVADNASTDDSVAYVQEKFPEVKIIRNKTNGGFAKGYNEALRGLSEDIFILLNSDVEVTPQWLPSILTEFKNNPKTAAIQPKIRSFRQKDYFEYAGAAGGFIDKFGYPYCRGRLFEKLEQDKGQYDTSCDIFWASGACLAIRKMDFLAAGQFDEAYFAHQEEIDLCWRLFNMKKRVKYIPDSIVYHLGGGTLASIHPKKTFYNFRNSLFSIVKNVPGNNMFFILSIRMLLDSIAGIKFLVEGKPKHFLAIIQAHRSFYSEFREFYRKRKKLPHKQGEYFHKTSVLFSYYVLGKTKFQDL